MCQIYSDEPYLRWLEMGRLELVDNLGMSVEQLARDGYIFAVSRLEIDYRVPALLGDIVQIETEVDRVRRVRFSVKQRVVRVADQRLLVDAKVMLACVDSVGKLIALPDPLVDALANCIV